MKTEAPTSLCDIFVAITEYALRQGVTNIKDLPRCWECQIDSQWWIALNGHPEPTLCSRKVKVRPFTAYLEFNGWPAGDVDPYGGIIAAGTLANEDNLLAALKGN